MRHRFGRYGCAVILALAAVSTAAAQSPRGRWVATWATALVARPQNPQLPGPPGPAPFMASECRSFTPATPTVAPPPGVVFAPQPFVHFTNQTLRQIVHSTIGGSRSRVVISNMYGTAPITIGGAHIALRDKEDTIQPPGQPVTFSGRSSMTLPAGAIAYSDPIDLVIPPLTDLAIDVYLPGTTNTPAPLSMHAEAFTTSYISETGNYAGQRRLPQVATTASWFLLSRVEVDAHDAAGVILTIGDSITDGTGSTPDGNSRWPDVLARRLQSATPAMKFAIANAGIGGNRLLSEGSYSRGLNILGRFDNDALNQPGVTHIVVLEGINDIGQARQNPTPTAGDLIAAHQQLVERGHARGITMIGATLTPYWGASYYTEVGEAKRQSLNDWIRTSHVYDGVIDFDKATRDPGDPKRLLAAYDSCDHLHPNDAGYEAMGEAIDLALFRR